MPAKTGAQREAKRRTQGRAIACVIRDRDALSALAALERKHGGVTAAVVAALKGHARGPAGPCAS
jgi:hypothetical protein